MRASYATAGFTDRDVESALDEIAAAGFREAEILGQKPHVASPLRGKPLVEFNRRLQARGLRATVHAPLTRNVLGAPEESWRREIVGILDAYLQFTAGVGAEEMVVHPVPNPIFVPQPTDPGLPALMRDAARRSLDELVPVSQANGVRLLLENLPYECDYPLLSIGELKDLVGSYPPDCVGLLVDTGHAVVTGRDAAREILLAGGRLCGIHLHDSDGREDRHWLPGKGVIDWDAVRGALIEIDYDGPWIMELAASGRSETPEALCRNALDVLTRWETRH